MRNLALVWVLAGVAVALLAAGDSVRMADGADADYCIDSKGKHPTLKFVKKNNDLKPVLLDIRESIECENGYTDTSVWLKYIDKDGKRVSSLMKGLTGTFSFGFQTITTLKGDSIGCDFIETEGTMKWAGREKLGKLSKTIQAVYPMESDAILGNIFKFKNKIIDAAIDIKLNCPTIDLDTMLTTNFRAKITGECECDSIKESPK